MEKIRVLCKNTMENIAVEAGTTLLDLLNKLKYDQSGMKVLAAYVNHELKELSYKIYLASEVRFLTYDDIDGRRCYHRSLSLLTQRAIAELYPNHTLFLKYNLPNGQYGELRDKENIGQILSLDDIDIKKIKDKMKELEKKDLSIIKSKIPTSEAKEIFLSRGQHNKARLIESLGKYFVSVYY